MKNRYSKSTAGQNQQVIVAKAVAYTTDADYQTFVSLAVDGEIGVFLVYDASGPTIYTEATAALNAADAALQAADKFFIAKMHVHVDANGETKRFVQKTPVMTYSECTVKTQAYVAPVKQITNVGYTGTSGSLNSGTLVNDQIFAIKLTDNSSANQPFPSWNFEDVSRQGDTLQSIGARILKQVNDTTYAFNAANGRLVDAELLTNGTFTVNTVGSGNVGVTNGSTTVTATGHNVTAGTYVRIGGTTGGFAVYKVASVATNSFELTTIYTGATNAALAIANLGTMSAITEIGFKFTALYFGTHFKVFLSEDTVSADLAYTTPYVEGNGTSDQVLQMEREGQVFEGYASANDSFAEDFGKPADYTVSGTTYQFIFLNYYRQMKAANVPNINDAHYGHIVLCLPVGVAPTTNVDGIFV